MNVNTAKTEGRRAMHDESWDELLTDIQKLTSDETRMLGNWSLGQAFGHVAKALNASNES